MLVKLMTVATMFLAGSQAKAGAYGFECSNSSGSINIGKQYASILPENLIGSDQRAEQVEYKSKTLQDFANEEIYNTKGALRIEVKGKKNVLSLKTGKTSCGDDKQTEFFTARVIVQDLKTNKILDDDLVICRNYFEGGHCVGEGID